jgi:hypothetical protein
LTRHQIAQEIKTSKQIDASDFNEMYLIYLLGMEDIVCKLQKIREILYQEFGCSTDTFDL